MVSGRVERAAVEYELEDAGAIDGFRVFDDQELFARTQDAGRSGEGGPAWLVPIVAGALAVAWIVAGWQGAWRLWRKLRGR